MNFTGLLPVFTVIGYLAIFVKCEFSFMSTLSSTFSKIKRSTMYAPCILTECCRDDYISSDIDKLDDIFNTNLYGQEIAHHVIINALRGHLTNSDPPKALSMSFHGSQGTGKTYTSQMIAKFLHKNGDKSNFYNFFNGRNDFPLQEKVNDYKEELFTTIVNSLQKCERSLFIFDEVDKMPEGLLNVLVPFLDYNTSIKPLKLKGTSINTRKAIYIFLSNTGSFRINQQLLTLWGEGKHRKAIKLQDFENLISVGAFNEKGGFYRSDAIDSSVIDHYIPFLPLEEVHVRKCLKNAFLNRGIEPTEKMIIEGLSYVVFGPPPHNLYAVAGCKRLEQKVATIIYSNRKERVEL